MCLAFEARGACSSSGSGARLRADGEDETHTERMTSARPEVERPFKAGSPRDNIHVYCRFV